MEIEYKLNDKKWKITMLSKKPQSDEAEKLNFTEGCRATVKLLSVDDEKICLDFSRQQGSSWHFFETVKQLKEQLSDINDATYE